ncbi:MAG: acyl-CoA dehydrogenase family protein [Acetobacteraceae bacterium]|nr:acyl-CoA dehydrogenase family protein [Acetobacteraceae bacterium]
MPSYLSPKGEAILGQLGALAPAIAAAAPEIDRTRDLPPALADALRAQDLFRLVQPCEYGGIELDPPSLMQVVEEVAKHDASTAWCLGQTNICAYVTGFLPPETVRTIFGPQTGIVAWGPGPAQAQVVPGGYRLTGTFDFASGSRLATWLGAHVPVIEADGSRRSGSDGKPTITTLLFPKDNAEIRDTWQVMGLRGTGSDSYSVTDLFVPDACSLHRHPDVRPRVAGKLYVFTQSTLYAPSFASIAFGIARAFMDAFIRDLKDTTPRGAARSRGENHVVQATVGQSEARLRSARTYLLSEVAEIWAEAQAQDVLTPDQLLRIRMASTWGIQSARQVVADLYAAAGALAIFDIRPFERRFRDIHTVTQQFQGQAAHFETVGQALLGRETDRPMFTF